MARLFKFILLRQSSWRLSVNSARSPSQGPLVDTSHEPVATGATSRNWIIVPVFAQRTSSNADA